MSEKIITPTIDEVGKTIKLAGLKREINISYSADVEFTDLVSLLAESIAENTKVSFTVPAKEDPKLKLVLETIHEIFSKYNDLFEEPPAPSTTATPDEDLPF